MVLALEGESHACTCIYDHVHNFLSWSSLSMVVFQLDLGTQQCHESPIHGTRRMKAQGAWLTSASFRMHQRYVCGDVPEPPRVFEISKGEDPLGDWDHWQQKLLRKLLL